MADGKRVVVLLGVGLLLSSPIRAVADEPQNGPATLTPTTPEPEPEPEPTDDALQVPPTLAPLAPEPTSAGEPKAPLASYTAFVPFGHQGEWVLLGSSNSLRVSNETFSNSSASFFHAGGEVGIDTFIADNVSLGLDVAASYADSKGYGVTALTETTSSEVSAGLRFGVNVPLGALFSWYPRLTLALATTHSTTTPIMSSVGTSLPPPSSESSVGPAMNLYAPLLVHLASHLMVGFGPRLQHNFGAEQGGPYDGSQSTAISGQFVVGGWWGGRAAEAAGDANASFASANERRDHHFGEQGQIALTFATDASVSYRSFSRSAASETDTNFNPSFDYFLENGVSVGVDAFIGHATGTSIDASQTVTRFSSTNRGIAPRLGDNLALTHFVSIWLRGEIGIGSVDQAATSIQGTNQHARTRTWLDFSAPLLVHPSTHFFVGGGPFLFHELSDKDQFNFENAATELGAQLLIGGWFAAPGAHPT